MEEARYAVMVWGEEKVGIMVGRHCDPSYNDIELLFPDGSRGWFGFEEARKLKQEEDSTKK